MIKGFYIYYQTKRGYLGVDKKVDDQVKFMSKYIDMEKITIPKKKTNVIKSIIWRMPFGSYGREYTVAEKIVKDVDVIYIRFVPIDLQFINFIKQLKKNNKNAKIFLEIATYPYASELLNKTEMVPFYFKDLVYHRFLKEYVDKVVTYSDDSEIYGISAIQIKNGIDVNRIQLVNNIVKKDNSINLIAVASFQKTHGYERCIYSLAKYYAQGGKRNIKIIFVGDGAELDFYRQLVKENSLEQYIVFTGRKEGEQLQEIYDCADVALGIFGLYKMSVHKSSALKIREYLAMGLPVVSACEEDAFDCENTKYYYQLENNDTVFDMREIVDFYDMVYGNNQDRRIIREDIRQYALRNIDISVTFKKVIEEINVCKKGL